MPSRISTANFNYPLTTYAQGHMQDRLSLYRIAQLIMPIVRVDAAAGTYKKFDDRNSFLAPETRRGMGGHRTRLTFDATDATYDCTPHGLEIAIDDHERERVGGANQMANDLLDQGKVQAMLSQKATAYGKRAIDFVIANSTAVTDRGNWSTDAIDPIDQIDEQLEALATEVGSENNIKLILGLPAWTILRRNAKAKARMTGIKTALKKEDLIDMLSLPVQLEIGVASLTATKRGQTVASITKTNILGGYAFLMYSLPTPTIYDPTPYKCFSTSDVLVESVKTYRDESSSSDVHCVDWSECMKETSSLAMRMLAIT